MTDETEAVRAWVESSGRALELRVARAFQRAGAEVGLSVPYAIQQQAREADVIADYPWVPIGGGRARVRVSIECKHSTSHPWVAFYDDMSDSGMENLTDWSVFAHGSFDAVTSPLAQLWLSKEPFTEQRTATHVVSAHGGSNNPANDAVRQALSASEGHQEEYIRTQSAERRGLVALSAVVTTAHLFAAWLDGDGELTLAPVERFDVWGHDSAGSRRRVFVRRESTLVQFAEGLRERAIDADREARSRE